MRVLQVRTADESLIDVSISRKSIFEYSMNHVKANIQKDPSRLNPN
jgi:hypothetical protein